MPTLTICVTTDWEGQNLQNANLAAMNQFRLAFPNVPLTHFICPAYLTRGGDLNQISGLIQAQIRQHDEAALHIHCWQTLVAAAGVNAVLQPKYYINGNGPAVPYGNGQTDQGHGVPLGQYSAHDVGLIIAHSNQLLVQNHIAPGTPASFRCGGWLSADSVQQALQAQGMANDSSCTDAPYFGQIDNLLQQFNVSIGNWVSRLWGANALNNPGYLANTLSHAVLPGGGTSTTQPYGINGVFQVPDNGVLADYLDAQRIYDRLHAAAQQAAQNDVVHVCGFHQESATGRNLYNLTPNLQNLSVALAQFLHDVGGVDTGAVDADDLAEAGIAPAGAERSALLANVTVVFNTVRGARKKDAGVGATYVPLKGPEKTRHRELLARAGAAQVPMSERFWG